MVERIEEAGFSDWFVFFSDVKVQPGGGEEGRERMRMSSEERV